MCVEISLNISLNNYFLGADLLPTDFQPADNYCLLAAHIFIKVWENTG